MNFYSDYSPNFINLLQNLFKFPFLKTFPTHSDQCTESLVNHDFFSFCCWFSSNKIKIQYFLSILLCVGKGIQEVDFILKGHTAYDVMICELFIWNLTKNIGNFNEIYENITMTFLIWENWKFMLTPKLINKQCCFSISRPSCCQRTMSRKSWNLSLSVILFSSLQNYKSKK